MIKKSAAYDVVFGIVTTVGHTIPDAPQGGTVRLSDEPLPSSGYWVGGGGQELIYDSLVTLRGSEVRAFVAACPTDYVGWWVDSETGRIHLDWVDWTGSRTGAHWLGRQRGEIAIWDIANAKEIRL